MADRVKAHRCFSYNSL